jgi:hypothetical protein
MSRDMLASRIQAFPVDLISPRYCSTAECNLPTTLHGGDRIRSLSTLPVMCRLILIPISSLGRSHGQSPEDGTCVDRHHLCTPHLLSAYSQYSLAKTHEFLVPSFRLLNFAYAALMLPQSSLRPALPSQMAAADVVLRQDEPHEVIANDLVNNASHNGSAPFGPSDKHQGIPSTVS